VLTTRGALLETVSIFKYFGRLLLNMDEDWLAVYAHLHKAQKSWTRISHILARGGATPRVSGIFYKVVVQSILLFGLERWVVTKLGTLVIWQDPYLCQATGEWIYLSIDQALEEVGLWPIEKYTKKQKYCSRLCGHTAYL
jgi:hypothetical protein